MQGYINSSVVGGRSGYIFNDIFAMGSKGDYIVDDYNKRQLNRDHPIKLITVSSGWIVDGIAITYNLADGADVTFTHGSQWKEPTASIEFGPSEVLVGVFGRAGYQTFYKRDMVGSIGFVICDLATGTVRVEGPFGNSEGSNEGEPFYSSDILAFGGFAENTSHLGLSGLFFFKDLSKQ